MSISCLLLLIGYCLEKLLVLKWLSELHRNVDPVAMHCFTIGKCLKNKKEKTFTIESLMLPQIPA